MAIHGDGKVLQNGFETEILALDTDLDSLTICLDQMDMSPPQNHTPYFFLHFFIFRNCTLVIFRKENLNNWIWQEDIIYG